ncbi:MAG: galactonate dehydratase [Candidatus Latescibacteria bacterium]|nr:galactonate dehydratase [Candidatus Latescibacterota bacterium]
MTIRDINVFPVWEGWRNYLIVKVDTDEGLYGIGEGGLTWRELAVLETINSLKPLLIGQDATRIEHLWQVMFRSGFFPGERTLSSAISAIDIALWDIQGKAFGVPVYRLLGGRCRDRVVCYPHCDSSTTDGLVENAKKAVTDGWKFIRFHLPSDGDVLEPSRAVRRAIQACAAVREAVGDDIELLLDVHTRLDPADAITLCRAVEPYRLYFVEDPLRSENTASYHQLRRHVAVPLGVGEHYASKWEFRELIEHDLINYARVDVCLVGGLTEAKKVAGWCETHYINLAPHNPLGPVSAAACLHLDLAAPNFGVQELPRKPGAMSDVFPVQVEWKDGYLLPPDRPGLGVEFDEDAARKHPYQPGQTPMLHREDGAFTNW